jgi:hypothetical protein
MSAIRQWSGLALLSAGLLLGCGGSDPAGPRVVPGGGIGDGPIDGALYVHVIDSFSDAPVVSATVEVGATQVVTSTAGLAEFSGLSGPQTVTVKASGYRSAMWVGANGTNVTVALEALIPAPVPQATLSGTIAGFADLNLGANHLAGAIVGYSQVPGVGKRENELQTPDGGNMCVSFLSPACEWTVVSRTGNVALMAALYDVDTRGTPTGDDDSVTLIGYAYRTGLVVADGVDQSGIMLTMLEAGNLATASVDFGSRPAGLPDGAAQLAIDVGSDGILPMTAVSIEEPAATVPALAAFAGSSYQLLGFSASQALGAVSIVIRRGITTTSLSAGTWLVPPTSVTANPTAVSFGRVAGATVHQATFTQDGTSVLEIIVADESTSVAIPPLVALPSGTIEGRVSGIGADFDVQDFSLDEVEDEVWGLAQQSVTITN